MQNQTMGSRRLAGAAVLLSAVCGSSSAQCSSATVRGAWGWQSHGIALMNVPGSPAPVPVPFASLGIMKVDDQGRYTARTIMSAGGQLQEFEFPGSIQVNADCTATDTYTAGFVAGTDRLVILGHGTEMQVMPTRHPLGPVTGRAAFWRVAWGELHCNSRMVRGVYGGAAEGTVMLPVSGQPLPAPAPYSAIGTISLQPGGSGASRTTVSLGGTLLDMESNDVSVEVDNDCIATLRWTAASAQAPGQTFAGTAKYIVLHYGQELAGLHTGSSAGLPVVIDNYKRIALAPAVPGR